MAKQHETTQEEANMIAEALETMAEVVRRHPPSRYEIGTNQHITDVYRGPYVERADAGLENFRCALEFPPGVRMPEPTKPSGLDPRLEAIRGALDSTPIEVICNSDDAWRVRAALVGMGRPFELHARSDIRPGRVIVVNKAKIVHLPGEDPNQKLRKPTREELIKSGDLVELPDYWAGP
jgi:hypothetical protein